MDRLTGNKRLVYQELQARAGQPVSLGTLACLCGCHKRTIQRAVQEMTARGLIYYERGYPNRYEVKI